MMFEECVAIVLSFLYTESFFIYVNLVNTMKMFTELTTYFLILWEIRKIYILFFLLKKIRPIYL